MNPIINPIVGTKVGFKLKHTFVPCGTISEITNNRRIIVTASGRKFYQRFDNGLWYYRRIWPMIEQID